MDIPKRAKPEQSQARPGRRAKMEPKPITDNPDYKPSGKLKDKVALITGGDSGIGRAVAILFAKEGARVVINYLAEKEDAEDTKKIIEKYGGKAILAPGDIGRETFCQSLVAKTIKTSGRIDILVNNAAEQHVSRSILDITDAQLKRTFATNIFSMFYLVKAVLPYMKKGSSIVNTTSITAYKGNAMLLDYSATKGAIVAFTRSLSQGLLKLGIRVNAVAPGHTWTPLIPASFPKHTIPDFDQTPFGRAAEPVEVAPSFLFLASPENSFMSGQVLHPNGGVIING